MLKNFWNDAKNLTRFQFGCKYIFPLFAAILTWVAIGNFYTAGLNNKQLAKYTGRVDKIVTVFESSNRRRSTYRHHSLKVVMLQYNEVFRVRDDFEKFFPTLEHDVNEGDTVTVYKRTPLQKR